jgi:HD-GYP domain-containing protein (c-di-GMP phosphodiesterase class II)
MTEHMGFPVSVVRDQRRAGLLHDIGKLAISNRILDKPAPLTAGELAKIK